MLRYYRRLLSVAFWHAWGVYEFACGAVGLLLPLVQKLNPSWDQSSMAELVWQMTACGLGTLFLVRLILAPWWMHKEQEVKLVDAQKQLTDKANDLAEYDRRTEAERLAHQAELHRARTSDPKKNAMRHGVERFIRQFEEMKERAAQGALLAAELYPLESRANSYLQECLPQYKHFCEDYKIIGGYGGQERIPRNEATLRCEDRLKRLREVLSLVS